MKDFQNFPIFEKEFQKYVSSLSYEELERGITKVFVNPNLSNRFTGEIQGLKFFKLRELEILMLMTWYMPSEEIAWFVRLQILEEQKRFSLEDRIRLSLLSDSKNESRLYFLEFVDLHSRDIFGNILPEIRKKFQFLRFKIPDLRTLPEKRRIGVGYKDKGHLASADHRVGRDYELEKLHEEIERRRKSFFDTLDLLRGSGG